MFSVLIEEKTIIIIIKRYVTKSSIMQCSLCDRVQALQAEQFTELQYTALLPH